MALVLLLGSIRRTGQFSPVHRPTAVTFLATRHLTRDISSRDLARASRPQEEAAAKQEVGETVSGRFCEVSLSVLGVYFGMSQSGALPVL